MIKQSFTLRVLAISFLVLALPLLIDSFIFFQNSYNESIKDAKANLKESANFRVFTLAEIEPAKQILLREIDYLLNLSLDKEDLGKDDLNQKLAEVAHIGGNFQIFLLDIAKKGEYKILASSLHTFINATFKSYRKLDHIIQVGEGMFIRYGLSHQKERFVPYLFVAKVLYSKKTGKPLVLLMINTDIEGQLNSVLSVPGKGEDVKFAVLNADGVVFNATDHSLVGHYFDPLSPMRRKEIIASKQMGNITLPRHPLPVITGDDPPFFEFIFDDQVQIAYRSFLSDFGISMVAYSPKEEFFGKAVRHFLFIYSLYGLIFLIGGGVTYWLSLWISRPLRQLSSLMREVSRGNLDVRFENEPLGFEINILGGIFNNTLVNLLDNIQRAEDERVKKETYQRELAIGRRVQRSLIPSKMPEISGAKIAGIYLPALEVGGDFYTYIPRHAKSGEEILVIAVADAAGKGISPCLYSLSVRSLFRTFATLVDDPGEVLSRTNNAFMEDARDTGMFVTMFGGIFHANSKILSYYSCGHVPPIVRHADGRLEKLEHAGMALGLRKSKGYLTDSIQLQSGDIVIFYTNGLTEAVNEHYQPFSEKRLRNCLQQRKWATAQEVIDGLTTELQSFTGSASQVEEVIMIALKVD